MKAIQVDEFGGPEVLAYKDVPRPEPAPGEILVKIEAAGVNFIDVYHRTGAYETGLPLTPGMEGAGEVAAVGMDVLRFDRGDRVAYTMVMGSYAEYATVPAEKAVRVPDGIDLRLPTKSNRAPNQARPSKVGLCVSLRRTKTPLETCLDSIPMVGPARIGRESRDAVQSAVCSGVEGRGVLDTESDKRSK
jgi:hypothetical protein